MSGFLIDPATGAYLIDPATGDFLIDGGASTSTGGGSTSTSTGGGSTSTSTGSISPVFPPVDTSLTSPVLFTRRRWQEMQDEVQRAATMRWYEGHVKAMEERAIRKRARR